MGFSTACQADIALDLARPTFSESISTLVEAYQNGATTPNAVVTSTLERIRNLDPDNRTFVALDEQRVIERVSHLQMTGYRSDMPLYGVPFSIKDLIDVRGFRTECGSPHQNAKIAKTNAHIVTKLERAGAIVIGKVATTEFAASGYHPDLSPPSNPLNSEFVVGVSSGGSAVSLAAGLVFGSIGTDTGGSIRMPAAACGVVGLKPTFGAVSRHGITPLAPSLDHCGPMARSVDDVERIFAVIRGNDARDPATRQRFRRRTSPTKHPTLRIGWDEQFCTDGVDDAMRSAGRGALHSLASCGHEIIPIDLGRCLQISEYWKDVVACEFLASMHHRISHPDELGPVITDLLTHARRVTGDDICTAEMLRIGLIKQLDAVFQSIDVLVTPTEPFATLKWTQFPPQFVTPTRALGRALRFAAPFNFAGCPSLAVPYGLADSGMPTSVQLVAAWNNEATLFRLGKQLETTELSRQAFAKRDDRHLREPIL